MYNKTKHIKIAPTPSSAPLIENQSHEITSATSTISTQLPSKNNSRSISLSRRNARERSRVKEVNNRFANLQHHIPKSIIEGTRNDSNHGHSQKHMKKLSKVDTLKLAVEYIRHLQDQLSEATSTRSLNMVESSSAIIKNSNDSIQSNQYYSASCSSNASTYSEELCDLQLSTSLEPNLFHFQSDNASFPMQEKTQELCKFW